MERKERGGEGSLVLGSVVADRLWHGAWWGRAWLELSRKLEEKGSIHQGLHTIGVL